jgi:Domain of unknown function (DUF4136)
LNRIVALAALACCVSSISAHTRVDFDHRHSFSQYRTYSWVQSPEPLPPGATYPNELMQRRVMTFVDQALAAKHLTRVPSGGDLQLSYAVDVHPQTVLTTFTDPVGPGWAWGWGGGAIATTTPATFWIGTLVVNMTDTHRNALVFQGTSTYTLSSKPAKNTKKFAHAVEEIFEKYPPRS